MILLDTNILGRITNAADPQYTVSRKALDTLRIKGERLVIVPQNLFEFRAIATRPPGKKPAGQNGLGMKIDQAKAWINFFMRRFVFLPDRPELAPSWLSLVSDKKVAGYKSHDARLVAAMNTFNITRILTFNNADFSNLGISVVDPAAV